MKLENYVAIIPGLETRFLVPYYFRRSNHLKALGLIAPPLALQRSLQVLTAAANVTTHTDSADGNDPKGLSNFDKPALEVGMDFLDCA